MQYATVFKLLGCCRQTCLVCSIFVYHRLKFLPLIFFSFSHSLYVHFGANGVLIQDSSSGVSQRLNTIRAWSHHILHRLSQNAPNSKKTSETLGGTYGVLLLILLPFILSNFCDCQFACVFGFYLKFGCNYLV